MDLTIREIETSDYPVVLRLLNNEIGNKSVTAENLAQHFEREKADDRYKTFVALQNGNPVGFASVVQSLSIGFDGGVLQIAGLAVLAEKQGNGIGSALLSYVESFARSRGVSRILLSSRFRRTAAHAFYEHKGYEKTSFSFSKSLD